MITIEQSGFHPPGRRRLPALPCFCNSLWDTGKGEFYRFNYIRFARCLRRDIPLQHLAHPRRLKRHEFRPVSYTHLQDALRAYAQWMNQASNAVARLRYSDILQDQLQGMAHATQPVSYTHLDVYKRQGTRSRQRSMATNSGSACTTKRPSRIRPCAPRNLLLAVTGRH